MAEAQKDFLFGLVKSLSSSEKRQFRLYVNRLGINADAKFLLLFDVVDKLKEYDETKILEKKITTKQQLSNLKAHLYRQILVSLRTNPSNQNTRIIIREQLDFATILYNKGLYKQALKLLDKTKQMALDFEEKDVAYEIVELEKVIESQYITRSISSRADDLIEDAKSLSKLNALNSKLSNLSLKLYGMMLANGYAKSDADKRKIEKFFRENLPQKDLELMQNREKLWYYKAHVWKHLLLQNFVAAYAYSLKWVQLFYQNPEMIANHPVWFIKGNNYLLNALFLLRKGARFEFYLKKFQETVGGEGFPANENIDAVVFTMLYNARMNLLFLRGDYTNAEDLVQEIRQHKEFHDDKIDEHHILILNFKIAATYFGNKNYGKCIAELQKIITSKEISIREDLGFHSRILALMAMIDSGLDEDMEEFTTETLRFYQRMKRQSAFYDLTVDAVKNLSGTLDSEKRLLAQEYILKFKDLAANPYNARSFLYLDLISWLEATVAKKDITEIIRAKSQ